MTRKRNRDTKLQAFLAAAYLGGCAATASPEGEATPSDPPTPVRPLKGASPAILDAAIRLPGTDSGTDVEDSDTDAGADVSTGCPPPADPCDCRTAIASCPGYTCGVAATCTAPFWFDRHYCYVAHRIGGADGCDLTDAGALCCEGTQSP